MNIDGSPSSCTQGGENINGGGGGGGNGITNPYTGDLIIFGSVTADATVTQPLQLTTKDYVDNNSVDPADILILEQKTQNQTAIVNETTFTGGIKTTNIEPEVAGGALQVITSGPLVLVGQSSAQLVSSATLQVTAPTTTVNGGTCTFNTPSTVVNGTLDVNGTIDSTVYQQNGQNVQFFKTPSLHSLTAGKLAGSSITTGQSNILIGTETGKTVSTGNANTAIGYQALVNSTGFANTAIGSGAQFGGAGVSTGTNNASVGNASLRSIESGSSNSGLGDSSGSNITTGGLNTCIGEFSGDGLTTGSNCTALGANSLNTNGINRTCVGANTQCDSDNQVSLGDINTTQIINTGDGICDLGSATHRFKDLYITGSIAGLPLPNVNKRSASSTGTVYEDTNVRFIWDGTNKQPKYLIKVSPAGSWIDGGIQLTHEPLSQEFITNVDDISTGVNTEYYFTDSGIRNSAFDMSNYGNLCSAWIIAETDTTYPSYYLKCIMGASTGNVNIIVEKY